MRVAVVIPCHNVEHCVHHAVGSALAQTHADLEVVAIDDHSTDGTAAALQRLADEAPGRFRWEPAQGRGAGAARNQGMRATTGEYVQFLDADDVIDPDKIAAQVALAVAAGRPALVMGGYRNLFPDGASGEVIPIDDDPWGALVKTRAGTTSANLWQRRVVEEAGAWREDLGSSQDHELLFRMLKRGARPKADPVIRTTILKRSHGSISRTSERENWLRYLDLRCAIRDHLSSTDSERHANTIRTADQYLFMAIRVLSKHDRAAAFKAYDTMIPPGFSPEVNAATGSSYVRVFRWFGFRTAERLAGLMTRAASRSVRT